MSVSPTGQFGISTFIGYRLHINIIFKMGDFAAELLNKLSLLGYQGDLSSQVLHSSLQAAGDLERFGMLFRYLSDTIDA